MAANSIVRLSLESAQYEQKLRGAKRQFEDFTNSIGINMKQLTAAGIAIGAAAAAINAFTDACGEAITRGAELAKQAEGIKRAFDRLNQPQLLDNLREATHNTVSDLELMKNAVKFDNFNLSLEQMGTFLAFAQQQAKDTGQSVEYMVDSIVTGLGRKSLPILDNLGLSAVDIRAKMAEVGDMTTAVAEIIKERMDKAGGYVETAADRAAQATATLENKMEELGRKFEPLKQASDDLWTSIKLGIMDIIGGPLTTLLNGLTQAGALRTEIARQGGSEAVTADINKLKGSNYKPQAYQMMLSSYFRKENEARNALLEAQKGGKGGIGIYETRYNAAKTLRQEFQQRGSAVLTPTKTPIQEQPQTSPTKTTPRATKASPINPYAGMFQNEAPVQTEGLAQTGIVDISSATRIGWGLSWRTRFNMEERSKQLESKNKPSDLEDKKDSANLADITGAVGNMFTCLENIGIEIPKGFAEAFGIMNTIVAIISAIQAMQEVGTFLGLFANGGVVHGANGIVPGRSFSGDNIPAMLNSGETVLTRAQSSNLVSMLNNNGLGNLQLETVVSGEDLKFVLNNTGRRTGTGEIMTSTMRRI